MPLPSEHIISLKQVENPELEPSPGDILSWKVGAAFLTPASSLLLHSARFAWSQCSGVGVCVCGNLAHNCPFTGRATKKVAMLAL